MHLPVQLQFLADYLRIRVSALGVMAPDASQRTALKEYCRAYPRAVVDCVMLYVEDYTFNNCTCVSVILNAVKNLIGADPSLYSG